MNLLTDPAVAAAIIEALRSYRFPRQDLQDGLHDVYLKALESFQKTPPPTELERMIALCAEIARNHAIDLARKAECRKRDLLATCDRDEYCPPQFGTKQRDPVDAGRQLEVLAQLFREGRMPDGGVEILEGIASGRSYEELAMGLGITDENARWRKSKRDTLKGLLAQCGLEPKGTYKIAGTGVVAVDPQTREHHECRERVHLVEGRPGQTESVYWHTTGQGQASYRYLIGRIGRHA